MREKAEWTPIRTVETNQEFTVTDFYLLLPSETIAVYCDFRGLTQK